MTIIIVISACFAYFGSVIGMYLILTKLDKDDKDSDSYERRVFSIIWPLWIWIVPIAAIIKAGKIIFDKIDEDTNEKE